MKKNSKYIKDHISKHGKDLRRATNEKFGITNSLIIRAVNGDEKALKQIGDMGKQGERLSTAMPLIREQLKEYIKGTTEYNKSLAEIYKEGGNGAAIISKSMMDTELNNTKYNNKMGENLAQHQINTNKEQQRHEDRTDIIELTAWIDSMMTDVDVKAQMEEITSRPYNAQLNADKEFEKRKIEHLLEHGSEGDLELIPQKHYSNNVAVKAWNWVADLFS